MPRYFPAFGNSLCPVSPQPRPPMQHVLVTGRGAKPELIDLADTVTEMAVVKHAFQAGIKAQKGIEL